MGQIRFLSLPRFDVPIFLAGKHKRQSGTRRRRRPPLYTQLSSARWNQTKKKRGKKSMPKEGGKLFLKCRGQLHHTFSSAGLGGRDTLPPLWIDRGDRIDFGFGRGENNECRQRVTQYPIITWTLSQSNILAPVLVLPISYFFLFSKLAPPE